MRFAQALIGARAEDYVAIGVAAEEAGFDAVALSDHVIYPKELHSKYPYTPDGRPQYDPSWDFPDPWVTVGALASVTERLEFFTNVYVLPARNPLVVAKAVGTAAALSAGRVRLGIGVGWMREEFDLLEQRFDNRGKRTDESIDVLRALFAGGMVHHDSANYHFDGIDMRPVPPGPVPVFVGGDSEVALRRAARNDGWIGVNYTLDQLEAHCATVHRLRAECGRGAEPFEIVASPLAAPRPDVIERLEAMGVTTILTSAWMAAGRDGSDRGEAIGMIRSYAEKFIEPLGHRAPRSTT